MAETAENLAEQYKLTRQAVDEVALASQQRAKQAWDACVFQDEVVPVPVKQKGQTVEFRKDEHMRPETTRSEEHTSELQSRLHLVCRLLLEKKKKHNTA